MGAGMRRKENEGCFIMADPTLRDARRCTVCGTDPADREGTSKQVGQAREPVTPVHRGEQ